MKKNEQKKLIAGAKKIHRDYPHVPPQFIVDLGARGLRPKHIRVVLDIIANVKVIPAMTPEMMMESVGEQMGWGRA
jgi:hypothetical protein